MPILTFDEVRAAAKRALAGPSGIDYAELLAKSKARRGEPTQADVDAFHDGLFKSLGQTKSAGWATEYNATRRSG